jgi:hypothetical protein
MLKYKEDIEKLVFVYTDSEGKSSLRSEPLRVYIQIPTPK